MTCIDAVNGPSALQIFFPDIQSFLVPYKSRGPVKAIFTIKGQDIETELPEGYFLDLTLWGMGYRFLAIPKIIDFGPTPQNSVIKVDLEILLKDENIYEGDGTVKFILMNTANKMRIKSKLSCLIE